MNFYEILWKRACEIQHAEFMAGNIKGFQLCATNILIYEALMRGDSVQAESLRERL